MSEIGGKEIDTELIHIIVSVPKETVTCSFSAKLLVDGKLVDAHMDMTPEEFRRARQDFLGNVEGGDEYDAVYTLTEEGKAYVERLIAEGREGLHDN